jgi:hypothetical protein
VRELSEGLASETEEITPLEQLDTTKFPELEQAR